MSDLENRLRAVERILEDESFTAGLTDDAARVLLDWGIAQAEGRSREQFDTKLADLRRTMKHINREAGKTAPEAQVERVQALLAEIEQMQDWEAENDA
ncbi:MAG: hypothetical protein ACE5OS_13085 [Anaerolineae bacterium]